MKGNKEISEARGGVGMRARAEGITVIGPRCESEQGEQGCETRGACETRETSEGRASDTKKGSCTGSTRADLTLGTWLPLKLGKWSASWCPIQPKLIFW